MQIKAISKDAIFQCRDGIRGSFKPKVSKSIAAALKCKSIDLKISCDENRVQVGEAIEDHFRESCQHPTVEEIQSCDIAVGSTSVVITRQVNKVKLSSSIDVVQSARINASDKGREGASRSFLGEAGPR